MFILNYRIYIFSIILLFSSTVIFASSLSKQEACSYPDGIVRESVYILWPGKIVQVDEFVKKDGFLYYFINVFPDQETVDAYRANGNNADTRQISVKNEGSFFASYDCSRSKVKFYSHIRSLGGTAYGKLNWIAGQYLSYSLIGRDRDPCTTWPDMILDMKTMTNLRFDTTMRLLKSSKKICVGRSMYKSIEDGKMQFDIEQYQRDTEESFYSRYQYQFSTKKLKKVG